MLSEKYDLQTSIFFSGPNARRTEFENPFFRIQKVIKRGYLLMKEDVKFHTNI